MLCCGCVPELEENRLFYSAKRTITSCGNIFGQDIVAVIDQSMVVNVLLTNCYSLGQCL